MKQDPVSALIGQRALNDYTANKANPPKVFVEPKKVATCISSYAPGMKLDLKPKSKINKQTN